MENSRPEGRLNLFNCEHPKILCPRFLRHSSPFARMLLKLFAQAFLGIGCSLKRFQRNFEVRGAVGADSNGWDRAEPFNYPKVTLVHVRY